MSTPDNPNAPQPRPWLEQINEQIATEMDVTFATGAFDEALDAYEKAQADAAQALEDLPADASADEIRTTWLATHTSLFAASKHAVEQGRAHIDAVLNLFGLKP